MWGMPNVQDPHNASREFLFGLQEENIFIYVYRFLHFYIFECPSELHQDVNYKDIIKRTIIKCLLEEQPESDTKNDLLNII